MSSKNNFIPGIILAVVVLIAGVFVGWTLPDRGTGYSAVYLTTGDMYFGKLYRFPRLHLKDVWYIQRGVDPASQSQQLGVLPLEDTFWGSEGKIYLSSEQVVWTAPISEDSPLMQVFSGSANTNTNTDASTSTGGNNNAESPQEQEAQSPE